MSLRRLFGGVFFVSVLGPTIKDVIQTAIMREISDADHGALRAYVFAAASGDGTRSRPHGTCRISQLGCEWPQTLQAIFRRIGQRAWVYREGRDRGVWVVETRDVFLSELPDLTQERNALAFLRGWFDSEGGMPHDNKARLYIQLAQKNPLSVVQWIEMLDRLGISCGRMHNPSARVDPDYWRIFIRASSHSDFMRRISSWHPDKRARIDARLALT